MKKSYFLYALFVILLNKFLPVFSMEGQISDFPHQLEEALVLQNGFRVLTVTRNLIKVEDEIIFQKKLRNNTIKEILDKTSEVCRETPEPIFVVFNEYFFQEKHWMRRNFIPC